MEKSFLLDLTDLMYYLLTSATPAFLRHETNSFLCLYRIWPSTRRFSGCECSLLSPLKFVMECSGTLAFLWHETNSFLCLYQFWPSTRRFSACECSPRPHWNLLWIAQRRLPFGDIRLTFLCVSPLLPLHTTFFSWWVFTPIPIAICCALPSVRQPRLPFCDMKLTLFCVSTNSGLLHDVFQDVSVHPVPIEICYGLLSDALTLLFCFFAGGMCPHHSPARISSDLNPCLLLIYGYIIR